MLRIIFLYLLVNCYEVMITKDETDVPEKHLRETCKE